MQWRRRCWTQRELLWGSAKLTPQNQRVSIDGTCSMHGVRAHGITVPYKKQHGRVPRKCTSGS